MIKKWKMGKKSGLTSGDKKIGITTYSNEIEKFSKMMFVKCGTKNFYAIHNCT